MLAKAAARSTLSRLALASAACLAIVAIGAGPALSSTGSGSNDLFRSLLPGETADLTGTANAEPTFSRTIGWEVAKSVDRCEPERPRRGLGDVRLHGLRDARRRDAELGGERTDHGQQSEQRAMSPTWS